MKKPTHNTARYAVLAHFGESEFDAEKWSFEKFITRWHILCSIYIYFDLKNAINTLPWRMMMRSRQSFRAIIA